MWCFFHHHSPSLFLSLFLSGRVLSGFWFEFSRAHRCGRCSQLPNHPCAYLLSDWPEEESHWLPVCITPQLPPFLTSNPRFSFAIFAFSCWLPCKLLDCPHLPALAANEFLTCFLCVISLSSVKAFLWMKWYISAIITLWSGVDRHDFVI